MQHDINDCPPRDPGSQQMPQFMDDLHSQPGQLTQTNQKADRRDSAFHRVRSRTFMRMKV